MHLCLFQILEIIRLFCWPIDRTLSGANTPSQNGSGSNAEVFHSPQISKGGSSLSDRLMSYPEHSFSERLIPHQRCS